MIKDLWVLLRMAFDVRLWRLLWRIHQEFRRDARYRFRHLVRALLHVAWHERLVPVPGGYLVSSFLPPLPSRAFAQLFEATPNDQNRYADHVRALRNAPISTFVSVSGRCAYRCAHCSAAGQATTPDPSAAQLKKAFAQLQQMGTAILGLTGGEPLLRPDLEELVRAIDDRSVSFLYTSGHTLTRARAQSLKDAGLFAVGISLDRVDAEAFDALRGRAGAHAAAVASVEHFRSVGGVHVMVQCVADGAFLARGEHQALARYAKAIGAHEIRFLESMPAGKVLGCDNPSYLSAAERETLVRFQARANWSSQYPKVTVFAHTESAQMFGCGAATQHSYIDAAGNFTPCDFVPLSFGNAFTTPLAATWRTMVAAVGGVPRSRCLAFELKPAFEKHAGALPLVGADAERVCRSCRSEEQLPKFYRLLAGKT